MRVDRARDVDHAREQAERVASHLEDRVSRIDPVAACEADSGDDFDISETD